MAIKAVFFDVGGTLVDETRMFSLWADWLKVERSAFMAAVGATIAREESHRRVFDMVAPGVDIAAERAARKAAGHEYRIEAQDLYPDAASCLAACRAAGLVVGIAGNQPADAEAALRACGLEHDHLATSSGWGLTKPDPAFFTRIVEETGLPPEQIAYVGDRVDNDVLPAAAAGMTAVLLVRGPWGVIQAQWPGAAQAHHVIWGLEELPRLLHSRA